MSRRSSERRLAPQAAGLVLCMFIVGLLVPFIVDRKTTTVTAPSGSALGASSGEVGDGVPAGGTGAPGQAGAGEPGGAGAAGGTGGPGGSAGPGSAPGTGGGSAGTQTPTNSDVGVSKSEIRIGILVVTFGAYDAVAAAVGVTREMQINGWKAAFAQENRQGGFAGRKLVPVFHEFDGSDVSGDSQRAACVAMGEDLQVFAVFTVFFTGDPINCLTERYRLPVISYDQQPDAYFQRARGLLVSVQPSFDRGMRNLIWQADALGVLKGKKIGILASNKPEDAPTIAQIGPELAKYGYSVAHTSKITTDPSQQAAQMAVEVQAMKAAGVNTIVQAVHPGIWYDEAERQDWRPQYLTWDAYAGCSDVKEHVNEGGPDGKQIHGLIAVCASNSGDRSLNVPPKKSELECAKNAGAGGVNMRDRASVAYAVTTVGCGMVKILAGGLRAAGVNPTRASFAAAIPPLQGIEFALYPPNNGFPAGRTDYGILVRPNRFDRTCPCFRPMSGFVKAKH